MREFIVGKNDAGQRLDRFVTKTIPLLPSSLTQKYIRLKRVKVGGKGANRDYRLAEGDSIQLYINDEFFEQPTEENAFLKVTDAKLQIVYEDENILLVNKERGMLCHSAGSFDHATLIARVQAYLYSKREWSPREENSFAPSLCNRIDRNTQGIVIAAKNAEALRVVNEKIKNREIDKFYLAAVHGRPNPPNGTLTGYIFKDSVKNRVYICDKSVPGAKTAVTEYKTLASKNSLSLVECRLLTGRTHQIRAQLADFGCPLLGDGKYGDDRKNKLFEESGQALCSYKITFAFSTDAGVLKYLTGKTFSVDYIDFRSKYFG